MELTIEQMKARIAQLEKAVTNNSAKGSSLRIGNKGGVSFYGVGRFPVTLYASQWVTLADHLPEILAFVKENAALLKSKPEKTTEQPTA